MTTQTMRNQVERIKTTLDDLKPKPAPTVKVLTKPSPDAGAEELVAFATELAEAQAAFDKVYVVTGRPELNRDPEAQVQYVDSELTASFAMLAGQPSTLGYKNALDDLVRSLSGNVLGPVANPTPDEYQINSWRNQ